MGKEMNQRKLLDFLMNQKKQGKTYADISIQIAKKFGIKKSTSALENMFRRNKHEYDLKSLKSVAEVKGEVVKERILTEFIKLVRQRKYIPIIAEFKQHSNAHHESIDRYFTNFEGLIEAAKKQDPETFENIIDETSFKEQDFTNLRKYIGKHKRFIITTAVTNCEPNAKVMKAIDTFCKANKAALLILPCSDPAKQGDRKNKWSLSDKLPKEKVVFRDVSLNDNLVISSIKMSAKQLQPLTGLKRIAHKQGSAIFASPKQFLEFSASSNNNTDIPRAIMTTGACTTPAYTTEMYMSERTAYLAEQDHTLGAIIVEVKDGKTFFFRQVQMDPTTGAFCDLDKKYYASGKVETIKADLIQTGDWHVLSTCPQTKKMAKELVTLLQPKYLTFEDFFDGLTINHHEAKNLVSLSKRSKIGMLSLETELKACRDELDEVCQWPAEQVIMKYGNHEDFLKRWIADGSFLTQPQNKILGMKLNIALEELEIMPFEYAMRQIYGLKNQDKITFLSVNDSFKVNGIENGAHGHLGKGGRRNPNLAEIEDCYGASNTGHNHSAGIFRSAWRVGTGTKLKLSYNDGPGAWSQTHLIQHKDGSRQLITNINGEYRLKD